MDTKNWVGVRREYKVIQTISSVSAWPDFYNLATR
jgi:hypothetical protein